MEQMYLIEILIDKVTIFASEEDDKSAASKSLIIKIKFGPKVQFIIKEGQLSPNDKKDDIVECDEQGRRKWTRTIRVGKSYLFPSYPDTVLMILNKFPLEIEVWNDDENEVEIFVGIGSMIWETEFYYMLKESTNLNVLHDPLTIKQRTTLYAECCCRQVGEIAFILRLSPLGDSIITEFQQLMKDPDSFVFRTNKAPSMFQCKRIEGDNPNFCMVGSLYETTTLEDPDVVNSAQQKIEICTEMQSCGADKGGTNATCKHSETDDEPKKYPIDKIRMGDITGPCGNTNCPLAHKVKQYIRALSTYKKEAAGKVLATKDNITGNVCGACNCKDDRYHREDCPDFKPHQQLALCGGCGGVVKHGESCEDKRKEMFGTGATPKGSKSTVAYVFSVTKVPDFKESMYGRDFIVDNLEADYKYFGSSDASTSRPTGGCSCHKSSAVPNTIGYVSSSPDIGSSDNKTSVRSIGVNNPRIYNVNKTASGRKVTTVYNCTLESEEKDCKCNPPKPTPPCKTFDCDCITEISNIEARKTHKPFCPLYKHKSNCPVLDILDDEEKKKLEEDEDEAESLPYGLPPIKLGPCPVLGRPCTVPDGFARMYKNAVLPVLPPSYSEAGKVCCSKEYERIKKAIKEYMKHEKENDFRCINRFNVDTERRCCDKEQRLLSLLGKGCCGSHKMSIQEKFKEEKK